MHHRRLVDSLVQNSCINSGARHRTPPGPDGAVKKYPALRNPLDNNYSEEMLGSVKVHIAAPPERLWSLVSDVTNTGRYSPETFGAQWLGGATGPALGASFRGHVRRNGKRWLVYWTKCTITKCEPGRVFAFDVLGPRGMPWVTWSYLFEPAAFGTTVTESFELARSPVLRVYDLFASKSRTRTNVANMKTTLDRLKAVAESLE